jgi:hypothetical protein
MTDTSLATLPPLTPTTSLADAIQDFTIAFDIAEDAFVRAGKILAQAVREHGPQVREAFAAARPAITAATWRRLEALGNGLLDARLVAGTSLGGAALRHLPIMYQREALDHGVEVALPGGDSIRIAVDNLTGPQIRQVFAATHIRDLAAQRAWLATNSPEAKLENADSDLWTVRGGKVRVARACTLTRLDLARMLAGLG